MAAKNGSKPKLAAVSNTRRVFDAIDSIHDLYVARGLIAGALALAAEAPDDDDSKDIFLNIQYCLEATDEKLAALTTKIDSSSVAPRSARIARIA